MTIIGFYVACNDYITGDGYLVFISFLTVSAIAIIGIWESGSGAGPKRRRKVRVKK